MNLLLLHTSNAHLPSREIWVNPIQIRKLCQEKIDGRETTIVELVGGDSIMVVELPQKIAEEIQ